MCSQLYALLCSKMEGIHMWNWHPYIVNWNILIFRMAASAFHQAIGTLQSHGHFNNSGLHHEQGDNYMRLISKGFKVEIGLSKRGCCRSVQRNIGVVQASTSQTSVFEPVLSPAKSNASSSQKKSSKPVILNLDTQPGRVIKD